MRKLLMAGLALSALSAQAIAEPAKVAITIYNDDTALVEDVRTIDLGAGRQRIEFPGVSARIRPETAALAGDGVEIIEQNFDFDLLTPYKMMEKAVGSDVRLVRVNPATGKETIETAKVLSANDGVVLKIGDRIEVLRDDGLPVRVLFDRIPENLRARPTLSMTVASTRAGARPLALRYLTSGIGWSADYVGVFDDKSGRLDLQGWVTLTNRSGAAYVDAKTQLIAGAPGQGGDQVIAAIEGGTGGGDDNTQFSDYHLYTLKLPTTIAENQTKQVSFIDAAGVKAQKVYLVERGGMSSQRNPESAAVKLRFANDAASGLGAALPAGTMRLYARDGAGRAQFIGEDDLGHIAQGSKVELAIGSAFDVTAQSQVTKRDAPKKGVTVTAITYTFRNARAEPATVLFTQGGLNPTHAFEETTAAPSKIDAQSYGWTITVPPRGETKLAFTVREGKEEKPSPQ